MLRTFLVFVATVLCAMLAPLGRTKRAGCSHQLLLVPIIFFAPFMSVPVITSTPAQAATTCPSGTAFNVSEADPTVCASGFDFPGVFTGVAFRTVLGTNPEAVQFAGAIADAQIANSSPIVTSSSSCHASNDGATTTQQIIPSQHFVGTCTYSITYALPGGATTMTGTINFFNGTIFNIGPVTISGGAFGPIGASADDTQSSAADFMLNRANNILNNQPDMIGFVDGTRGTGGSPLGNLQVNGTEGSQALAFSTSRSKILAAKRINTAFANADTQRAGTWDVWTEIYGARSTAGTSDSTFWIGHLGAHYFIDENNLFGIAGQLDWADETNSAGGSNAEGDGWMIGPYIAGQIEGQNLFYEARAAYGQSDNDISPDGTITASFDTTRWLLSGKLSGNIQKDEYTITPSVSVAYFEETQDAFTDSAVTLVPEQTISLGEVRFGPTISKAMELDNGTRFTPKLGLSGIWNFDADNNNASQANAIGDDDLRARIDLGFSATKPDTDTIFTIEGFYDGIGASDYDSYGGRARITIPLQ